MRIIRPTLLLDERRCLENIDRIVAKAVRSNVNLRPHFKTHQSHEIGRWFRSRGVTSCTVSSLSMASYFVEDNWSDITVAFPINIHEFETINRLAGKIKLNLLVSSTDVLSLLKPRISEKVNIYIDIDTGYNRTGFKPNDLQSIDIVLRQMTECTFFRFAGFLSHAGHSYKCRTYQEIKNIHEREIEFMDDLSRKYKLEFPDLKISVGDTPSCSVVENFEGVDEIRPGNSVFYDLTQAMIGSCALENIAVAMACPVVATYPKRNEIIIYGGGVHFSKDSLIDEQGIQLFGRVVLLKNNGWELPPTSMYLKSLSQEHGIIAAEEGEAADVKVGDILGILPVHSCLMANAMDSYQKLDGVVIDKMSSL